jgi:hypothetical protein
LAGTVIRALDADPSDVHAALDQEPDDDRPGGRSAARRGSPVSSTFSTGNRIGDQSDQRTGHT